MKIREGFVSNSSSASFLVALSKLTARQYLNIVDYNELKNYKEHSDHWDISVTDDGLDLKGTTYMDNGDLAIHLLQKEGLAVDANTSPNILDKLMLAHYGFKTENDTYY